jgi:hypothetical protein
VQYRIRKTQRYKQWKNVIENSSGVQPMNSTTQLPIFI